MPESESDTYTILQYGFDHLRDISWSEHHTSPLSVLFTSVYCLLNFILKLTVNKRLIHVTSSVKRHSSAFRVAVVYNPNSCVIGELITSLFGPYQLFSLTSVCCIPSTVKDISAHFRVCRNSSRSFAPICELCRLLILGLNSVFSFSILRQMDSNKWICHSWLRLINLVIPTGVSSSLIPGRPKRAMLWCLWNMHEMKRQQQQKTIYQSMSERAGC